MGVSPLLLNQENEQEKIIKSSRIDVLTNRIKDENYNNDHDNLIKNSFTNKNVEFKKSEILNPQNLSMQKTLNKNVKQTKSIDDFSVNVQALLLENLR